MTDELAWLDATAQAALVRSSVILSEAKNLAARRGARIEEGCSHDR